jgi:hypothetical protein
MFVSIAKSAATAVAVIVGSVLVLSASGALAQMSAQEKHEEAISQCESLMKGQRSFCILEANNQYQVDSAKAENKDVTVHYDYDTSNDTAQQQSATQAYNEATSKCMDLSKGQRSFCMIEAHSKYEEGMNWQ